MSRSIWKFEFKVEDNVELGMPAGAYPLHVERVRLNTLALWVEVDTNAETESRWFEVYGTGHELRESPGDRTHLATVFDGPFVWHVYERQDGTP